MRDEGGQDRRAGAGRTRLYRAAASLHPRAARRRAQARSGADVRRRPSRDRNQGSQGLVPDQARRHAPPGRVHQGGRRGQYRNPPRRDAGGGRRIGFRQDDARLGHFAAHLVGRADRIFRQQDRGADVQENAAVPPPHADRVPGSLRLALPAHVGLRHHRGRLVGASPKADQSGARGARDPRAARRRPRSRHALSLPARIFRRSTPAHRGRPRHRAGADLRRARRAHERARHAHPGADRRAFAHAAEAAQSHLHVHLARSQGGRRARLPPPRYASRQGGGGGTRGRGFRPSQERLYARAARCRLQPGDGARGRGRAVKGTPRLRRFPAAPSTTARWWSRCSGSRSTAAASPRSRTRVRSRASIGDAPKGEVMIRTPVCDLLQIEHPIALGGMGCHYLTPEQVHAGTAAVRELTNRPFALNFLLFDIEDDSFASALTLRPAVIAFAWPWPEQDVKPYVDRAHAAGCKVTFMAGGVPEAVRAAKAGADVIIAQGTEGGGHVGWQTTMTLVPMVVDAVAPVPVLAAGGIADGRGLAAAIMLGAAGVLLGTRFLASRESSLHANFKQAILESNGHDTLLSEIPDIAAGLVWPGAMSRSRRNRFIERWAGREWTLRQRRAEAKAALQAARKSGDVEEAVLSMGQDAGLIHDIAPAAEIVSRIAEDAERILTDGVTRFIKR